jgi:hypothetical protein
MLLYNILIVVVMKLCFKHNFFIHIYLFVEFESSSLLVILLIIFKLKFSLKKTFQDIIFSSNIISFASSILTPFPTKVLFNKKFSQ